jgi:hypothetical protein
LLHKINYRFLSSSINAVYCSSKFEIHSRYPVRVPVE